MSRPLRNLVAGLRALALIFLVGISDFTERLFSQLQIQQCGATS